MSRNRITTATTTVPDRYLLAERPESVTVDLLSPGKGFGVCVKLREIDGKLEIAVFTGLHHTLSMWDKVEFLVDLPDDENAPNEQEEGEDDEGEDDDGGEDDEEDEEDDEGDNEAAILAGMESGASGYNAARGYDTEEPEPCGHHYGYDCPRCGG
jgi:hypothetical protein